MAPIGANLLETYSNTPVRFNCELSESTKIPAFAIMPNLGAVEDHRSSFSFTPTLMMSFRLTVHLCALL
ncbi:MAG: hypothetical protein JWM99_3973 [Verrucomicrobiales bacterium]|nr:hypothetical protein [Verrucomicrobiales bacterium]